MLRIALTIYLAFATLVGPALCCCSARLWAAQIHTPTSRLASTESTLVGCPHCRKHATPAPTENPEPQKKPECPCCARGADPVLTQVETDASWVLSALQALSGLLPVDTLLASFVVESQLEPTTLVVGVPFLTAQDLLRTHHLLRC
jgi:hypothetical protein